MSHFGSGNIKDFFKNSSAVYVSCLYSDFHSFLFSFKFRSQSFLGFFLQSLVILNSSLLLERQTWDQTSQHILVNSWNVGISFFRILKVSLEVRKLHASRIKQNILLLSVENKLYFMVPGSDRVQCRWVSRDSISTHQTPASYFKSANSLSLYPSGPRYSFSYLFMYLFKI